MIGWPIDPRAWLWDVDGPLPAIIANRLEGLNALMSCGPWEGVKPGSLAELHAWGSDAEDDDLGDDGAYSDFKASLRTILDEEPDEDDPDVVMRAWELRNTPHAARGFRLLAEACPLLEEIEWQIPHYWLSMESNWVWKVCRDSSGRVRMMTPQKLTWTGSARGEPYPDILVGQELAYARWERDMLNVSSCT